MKRQRGLCGEVGTRFLAIDEAKHSWPSWWGTVVPLAGVMGLVWPLAVIVRAAGLTFRQVARA